MSVNNWRRRLDDRLDEKSGNKPRPDPPPRKAPRPRPRAAPARKPEAAIRHRQPSPAKPPKATSKPIPSASLVPHSRALSSLPLPTLDANDFRSLRALVLTICIIFGLALGFLYNITKENPPAAEQVKTPAQAESEIKTPLEKPSTENSEPVKPAVAIMPPEPRGQDVTADLIKETKKQLGEHSARDVFVEVNPGEYPTLLPKKPYGGLTGANAPPPNFTPPQQGKFGRPSPGLPLTPETLAPDLDLDF